MASVFSVSKITEEPDWFVSKLNSHIQYVPSSSASRESPIMQDDFLKPFLLDIGEYGLCYAYKKYYSDRSDAEKYKYFKTTHPKKIIIVGAGMSGLVAAYELAQAGHEVLILEMQHRVGGRVKTVADGKFSKGLWADAGAMRLPGAGRKDWTGPSHFMTDFYIDKFHLPVEKFVQCDDQTYYAFNGRPPIKKADWMKNPGKYCDEIWPGWRNNIKHGIEVSDISTYCKQTFRPVKAQLYKLLKADPQNAWSKWVQKWSQFTINDLVGSNLEEVLVKLKETGAYEPSDEIELSSLSGLIPWSCDAAIGFTSLNNGIPVDMPLIEILRFDVGKQFNEHMYTIQGGFETLPWAFLKQNHEGWNTEVELSKNIVFGVTVNEIQYSADSVTVLCHSGTDQKKKKAKKYYGDMVIVTVPLNIASKLKFSPSLPKNYYKAMDSIYRICTTKILLQCRTRFWEAEGIQGGSTLTDLPFCSIVYPSTGNRCSNQLQGSKSDRGILISYCYHDDDVQRLEEDSALMKTIQEISAIHPEIEENFEVGAVQSWGNDSSTQGALCLLRPKQDLPMDILFYPHQTIYFCGDALSNCNFWIQGAIISGLRAAYQVFIQNKLRSELVKPSSI